MPIWWTDDTLTAYDFLVHYLRGHHQQALPMSVERPGTQASNSEVRRWLTQGAVVINGQAPRPDDPVEFPIAELVFFPKGQRRTTVR